MPCNTIYGLDEHSRSLIDTWNNSHDKSHPLDAVSSIVNYKLQIMQVTCNNNRKLFLQDKKSPFNEELCRNEILHNEKDDLNKFSYGSPPKMNDILKSKGEAASQDFGSNDSSFDSRLDKSLVYLLYSKR